MKERYRHAHQRRFLATMKAGGAGEYAKGFINKVAT
jgi:hypothetical protein